MGYLVVHGFHAILLLAQKVEVSLFTSSGHADAGVGASASASFRYATRAIHSN